MVNITERYYCHDAYSICLSTLLPAIELILLVAFACKMPVEWLLWTPPIDSNNHAYLVS